MNLKIRILMAVMLAALASIPVAAQDGGRRMQGGGLNYGVPPQVYRVLSVDNYASTIKLRAADGRSGDVFVASGVYDVSKLKAGDLVQVDFVVPDAMNPRLAAASIWPVGQK
jgi:hypothetical protein